MTDILIQFHAVPEDLFDILQKFTQEQDIYVTAVRWPPFSAQLLKTSELPGALKDLSVTDLLFTIDRPSIDVTTMGEFETQNPDSLLLNIGRMDKDGLRESMFNVRTNDSTALTKWQLLAKRLRKMLRTGATVTNPGTGETARMRNHRFSAGAKQLQDQGIRMLPIAGGNVIILDD